MSTPDKAKRTCATEGCAVRFVPYNDRQRYHNKGCGAQDRSARYQKLDLPERVCPACGNTYKPKKRNQMTCGSGCSSKRRNDLRLTEHLRKLDDLLTSKGIDLSELDKASIKEVRFWEQGYKDAEGVGQVQKLSGIAFSPSWEAGPEWPVVTPGPATKLARRTAKPVTTGGQWRTAVILPDIQAGYWRDPDTGDLVPTHDEAALAVALAVIRDVNPSTVIWHGDNADFPELSRYRLTPTFQQTTQPTIDRCTLLGFEAREAAPNADLIWLAGNHEERLPHYVIDNAKAAFGLRRGETPKSWPVLSMPHLCRFDESGVTFVPGWPANDYWLNDNLQVIHGHKVRSGGSTAHAYLKDARASVIYGHTHRRETAEITRHTRKGARTVIAASFGCLCRIDGAVPSTKGGYDLHGRPLIHAEDWQQGAGVVHYEPGGKQRFVIESIPIWSGWALYRGTQYGNGGGA